MANPVSGIFKTVLDMFAKSEKAGEKLAKSSERIEPTVGKVDEVVEAAKTTPAEKSSIVIPERAPRKQKEAVTPEDVAVYLKDVKDGKVNRTSHVTETTAGTPSNTVEQTGRWEKTKDGFKDGASATGSFIGKYLKRGAIVVGIALGLNTVLPEDSKLGQLSGEVADTGVGLVKGATNSVGNMLKSGANTTGSMEASSAARLAKSEATENVAKENLCSQDGGRYGTITKECITVNFGEDYQGLRNAFFEIPNKEADLRYMKEMSSAIVELNERGNLSSDSLAEKRSKIMEEIKGNFTGKDGADFDVVDRKIAQTMGWGYSDRSPK